jgi:hypothetical protein
VAQKVSFLGECRIDGRLLFGTKVPRVDLEASE